MKSMTTLRMMSPMAIAARKISNGLMLPLLTNNRPLQNRCHVIFPMMNRARRYEPTIPASRCLPAHSEVRNSP